MLRPTLHCKIPYSINLHSFCRFDSCCENYARECLRLACMLERNTQVSGCTNSHSHHSQANSCIYSALTCEHITCTVVCRYHTLLVLFHVYLKPWISATRGWMGRIHSSSCQNALGARLVKMWHYAVLLRLGLLFLPQPVLTYYSVADYFRLDGGNNQVHSNSTSAQLNFNITNAHRKAMVYMNKDEATIQRGCMYGGALRKV